MMRQLKTERSGGRGLNLPGEWGGWSERSEVLLQVKRFNEK